MKNNEKILLGTTCFLAGIVGGFLIAPIKKGIYCGNNNGNLFANKEDLEKFLKHSENEINDFSK
ncbi:hypothetical protein [Clostridium ihumii]|uniref:hypothetical protein n=1 Tax=Clostridium ihumii TaxID=1470356 RepID=UPI003D33B077